MLQSISEYSEGASRTRFTLLIVFLTGLLLFILTYLGIQKSRSDSLELLRQQGTALTESLTLSADNAIKANSFFDLLVQEKFSDLTDFLEKQDGLLLSQSELSVFADKYGVDAVMVFNRESGLKAYGSGSGFVDVGEILSFVQSEVEDLFSDSIANYSFQIDDGGFPKDVSLYYLSKTAEHKYVIAIVSDALFYSNAKKDIGIGYLVQNIARQVGVEYILFQTAEGIVFSSRDIGPVLKIEKDIFLINAINSDTVLSREYVLNDRKILELVKRFYSEEYGEGIFRVGVSLEKYYDIIAGYDRQMIVLSIVIFAVFVFAILYLTGRQKRTYLDRSFRRMKSLSEKVFDSIHAGLIAIRKDGTIEMANRQFMDIFGIESNDIIATPWNEYSCKGVIPFEEVLSGSVSTGEIESTLEVPGGRKYLLINTARLHDSENRLTGVVAVVYDYTSIRELEDTARRKERLTELGDLAAGVAHEIRNPLNAISIAAQRLIVEQDNMKESESFAKQIKSEADRLNGIVTRFLSMARGERRIDKQTNIGEVIHESVNFIKLDLGRKNVILETNITADIFAAVSANRLKQLVINLVKNGIEACEKNGGNVIISLDENNGRVTLSVSDTGTGIPDQIREKIFSPYFTTKDKGTGLGLSIVHQIVEELEGDISVESSTEGGAKISINFPK